MGIEQEITDIAERIRFGLMFSLCPQFASVASAFIHVYLRFMIP